MSRIIISDVHGCYNTLLALVAKLPKDVPITFAGDLIDRGPDSRKVIEFVKDGGHDCVRGNHEQMMLDDLHFRFKNDKPEVFVDHYSSAWFQNGGNATLLSYLVDGYEKIEDETHLTSVHDVEVIGYHMAWLRKLPNHILYPEKNDKGEQLLVTHSTAARVWGVYSPDNPIFENNIMWERWNYPDKIDGIYNVYGHTPQKYSSNVKEHFACVDRGVYLKGVPGHGKLNALLWPELTIFEQENIE